MSIVHILWQGDIGGAERAVYQLVQAQVQHFDMQVAVAFGQLHGPYVTKIAETGATVIDLGLRSGHDVAKLFSMRRALRRYSIHHFHVAEPLIMLASMMTPDIRRIYTYRAGQHPRRGRRAVRLQLNRQLIRCAFHGISGNTAHGARIAETLFGLPSGSAYVTYNGLNFDLLTPQRNRVEARHSIGVTTENDFVIGTVSTLKSLKRTDWIIEAVARLPEHNWRLVIVGDGQDRNALEQLARRLHIADRVIFTGRQDHVADWLVGLDAFVLASSEESFGNAAVEAMALGVPTVVCSDGGGLLEHVIPGQTGWVINGIDDLADCLAMVSANRSAAAAVGEAGQLAVRQKYTVDKMVTAYNRLYEAAGCQTSLREQLRSL